MEQRAAEAAAERDTAATEKAASTDEHARILAEVAARAADEEGGRQRLLDRRGFVRQLEQELQSKAQLLRSLEGERTALEGELASLRERAGQAEAHRGGLDAELRNAERRRDASVEQAAFRSHEAARAAGEAEHARHLVAEAREREATLRAERRQAEESLAQITARREALEELERERVGLAPGAAALLDARDRFDGGVLGPLSDFVSAAREHAELAERLLGEWTHAVLVRDLATVDAVRAWHAETQPGALVLLPVEPGPAAPGDESQVDLRFRAEGAAAAWVRAALAGSQVLDTAGHVLRRASGAIFLGGAAAPSGPLRRRAELVTLANEAEQASLALGAAQAGLSDALSRLSAREQALATAQADADRAREAERQGVAAREDAVRFVTNLGRELSDADAQLARLRERLQRSEQRLVEVDAALVEGDVGRARLEEQLGAARADLAELEARPGAGPRAARAVAGPGGARVGRPPRRRRAARPRARHPADGGGRGTVADAGDRAARGRSLGARHPPGAMAGGAGRARRGAARAGGRGRGRGAGAPGRPMTRCTRWSASLVDVRALLDAHGEESHRLQLQLTEAAGLRRSIVERVETEWRKPFDVLLDEAVELALDLETLESESARITQALEAIGPVNPLAVEEHAEEVKRYEFLTSQRDDLVGARQALIQAIREIDGTARQMFVETFEAVKVNFHKVFQTLFGGGECDLRLSNADDPLESEIEILAAPRGKKIQHVRLLSQGERTLVATSLLFGLYLTKPSPFCLMDEVDAPLDDSNVGRFTRLLEEFKLTTQFIVITHNPRTMQAADAVFGVTMQEPGVSTIVGVRLGELQHA